MKQGSRPPRVGALFVGRREGQRIVYAGKIQVGLPLDPAAELRVTLQQFVQPKAPASHPLRRPKAVWLLPHLQAEVAYSNVTADGMLRHAMLKGAPVRPTSLSTQGEDHAVRGFLLA